jgi:protein SCO1
VTHDPASRAPGTFQRRIADLLGRRSFWVAFIAALMALPLVRGLTAPLPSRPEPIRSLPEFQLTNERGRPFGSADLRGKVWVADFIFTTCGTICPKLTEAMQQVQYRARNLKGAVHLVSFTVDPRNDTPQKLFAYADKHHALGAGDWSFLTGKATDLYWLAQEGFKMSYGNPPEEDEEHGERDVNAALVDIAHGQKLVLVDPDLKICGYYDPDPAGLDRLVRDMGLLANLYRPSNATMQIPPEAR